MKQKDAKLSGLTVYPADKPCSKCSTNLRYTSTGACRACLKNYRAQLPAPGKITDVVALPSNRRDAIRLGAKYFKPPGRCRNGHASVRLTRYNVCVMCRSERGRMARNLPPGHILLSIPQEFAVEITEFARALEANAALLRPKVQPPTLPPTRATERVIDPTN